MGGILEKVDRLESDDNKISLNEVMISFGELTEEEVKKFTIKMNDELLKKNPKYVLGFEPEATANEMLAKDINTMEEKNIKVYQLCKCLALLEQGKDPIKIDGKLEGIVLQDKINEYNKNLALVQGVENISYGISTDDISFHCPFGVAKISLTDIGTFSDTQKCIDKERQSLFDDRFIELRKLLGEEEYIALSSYNTITIGYTPSEGEQMICSFIIDKDIAPNSFSNFVQESLKEIQDYKNDIQIKEMDKMNQELLSSMDKANYVENLVNFGLPQNTKPVWLKLVTEIKTIEDLSKMKAENIGEYLKLPADTKDIDKPYICLNFQYLVGNYLTLFPDYKSPLLEEGLATGANIQDMQQGMDYYKNVLSKLDSLNKGKPRIGLGNVDLSKNLRRDAFTLYIGSQCQDKSDEEIATTLGDIFSGREKDCKSEKGLLDQTLKRNTTMTGLAESYILSRIQKYILSGTTGGEKGAYAILDISKKSEYERFKGKGNKSFDDLCAYTDNFYEQGKGLGLDASIPVDTIMLFYKYFELQNAKIANLEATKNKKAEEAIKLYHGDDGVLGGGDNAIDGFASTINTISYEYGPKIYDETLKLERAYVKLLLAKTPKPTGIIPGLSGKVTLDFSKGSTPDEIIRESFVEKASDQRDVFIDDMTNNRQRAFGSFNGMIGGIAGAAIVGFFTRNVWATSAGFTAGLRLGNGVGQEVWNTGEWVYEESGGKLEGANNKVDPFGVGFMRGLGVYDQNDKWVGTASFLSGIGFDYASAVITFGIGNKLAPFMEKLRGAAGMASKAFTRGVEELVIESFLVDIPLNILQTGVNTFTGIGNGSITGQTGLGNEKTATGGPDYQSGNFIDAMLSMKDATEQNFSFPNLSQVFLNTVVYGGLLEGGQAGIGKIKSYLPTNEVNKFEATAKESQKTLTEINSFIESNNISFNKETQQFFDAKTNTPISSTDSRIVELTNLLQKMEVMKMQNLEALQKLKEKHTEVIKDPKDKKGILFRLGLINGLETPGQIIDKRLAKLKEKILAEGQKIVEGTGDPKLVAKLEALKGEYEFARGTLNEAGFPIVDAEPDRGNNMNIIDPTPTNIVEITTKKSTVDPEVVIKNASIVDPKERIKAAKKLEGLENITSEQETAILAAHDLPGDVYDLDFTQLKAKVVILEAAKLSSAQIRTLLKNGICGKVKNYIMRMIDPGSSVKEVEILEPEAKYIIDRQGRKGKVVDVAFLGGAKVLYEGSENVVFLEEGQIMEVVSKDYVRVEKTINKEEFYKELTELQTIQNDKIAPLKTEIGNFEVEIEQRKKNIITMQEELINDKIKKNINNETGLSKEEIKVLEDKISEGNKNITLLQGKIGTAKIQKSMYENLLWERVKGINGEYTETELEKAIGQKKIFMSTIDEAINSIKPSQKVVEISEKVKNTYDEIVADIQKKIDGGIDVEKNTYLLKSMENLSSTSRTAKGELDASASANKKFKFEDITPEEAGIKALENFQKLSEYIYENKNMQFTSVDQVKIFVEKIAKEANDGILKSEYFMRDENPSIDKNTGKPKYAYTDKDGINTAFGQFCEEFYTKINDPTTDPLEFAARVEYRVNIKDHFFADGCGKTSILISNFVLMRYDRQLPIIRGEGKERFNYTGKAQRDANKPEYNPDLEVRTEYYKTQFILNDLKNIKDSGSRNAYIENYNKENLSKPVGGDLMIGLIDKSYIYIDKNGTLKYQTIENYVMDKINDTNSMQEIDNFIEKYNKTNPSKSKEMVLGWKDGYCFVRNDNNGEIKKVKIDENKIEKTVDFTKMSSQEILEYAIENTNLIIQKYQQSQKIGEEFVVDVDGFRKFLGAEDKVAAQLTHEGASYLADYYIDWIVKNNKELVGKNITIRFVGGGAGSGKSLVSKFSPNEVYNGVWDGTMKTYDNAKVKIDNAIKNGYNVQIDFVFRNMNDSRNNGVLKRTIEQNLGTRIDNIQDIIDGKYDNLLGNIDYIGRTLPLFAFKSGHLGSRATFAKLYVEGYHKNMTFYGGDGKLEFDEFVNLHKNDVFDENVAKQNVELIFKKGFISEQQYFELLGIDKK